MIWAMTGGGPGFATDVLASIVYKQYAAGFYGLSTAGNVIMLILIALLAFPLQRYLYKREEA
jgi:raffinose/stachyose/melibiose transport system permease protein